MSRLRVIIAPLDWGLGHATRMTPLIQHLCEKDVEVIIASAGRAAIWLENRFPELSHFKIPAYDISYKSGSANVDIASQIFKIRGSIKAENKWLSDFLAHNKVDGIISDNRYGCFSTALPSVLVTHQINLALPQPLRLAANALVKKHLKKFDAIWVPDYQGTANLSGQLSHENKMEKLEYLGPLSRLVPESEKSSKQYEFCVLISGPEPDRSRFEEATTNKLLSSDKTAILVCGTPEQNSDVQQKNLRKVAHLNDNELTKVLLSSKHIICRSGYSTIMDLHQLGLKGNLIPTPGQSEQQYLAHHMNTRGWKHFNNISDLDLKTCIVAGKGAPHSPEFEPLLDKFVASLLK